MPDDATRSAAHPFPSRDTPAQPQTTVDVHTDAANPTAVAADIRPVAPKDVLPARPPGYAIEGELGRGGMGVVYRARHLTLNRPAALKMVLGDARADSKAIIRFLAEAEAVAAVRHPHVVGVYEFGDADGRPFLALEFCPGGSLADRLAGGRRMPPGEAAALVRKLAAGVAAAHAQGIVHRDLKPGNVLFDAAGEPKVSDFGLAKRGAGADLTGSRAVLGTPAYMAPEQAKGGTKFVGPAADVWALGVILYECLSGRRPFTDSDPWALLHKVMTADPAGVRTLTREVPRDLDLICRKCLAKAPHERYATAAELADDLGRFLDGKPILARPAGPVERGWKWAKRNKPSVAVIVVLGLAAGFSSWQWYRAWAAEQATAAQLGLTQAAERVARGEESKARAAEAKAREAEGEAVRLAAEERKARLAEGKALVEAREVAQYMQTVFTQASARGQASPARRANPDLTVREAMDAAARKIDGRFKSRPEIEAAVRATIGDTYRELGLYPAARAHLEAAIALREATLGPAHPTTLTSVNSLAMVFGEMGDHGTAERLYGRAYGGWREGLGPDHPDTLTCANNLAVVHRARGDLPAAERVHRDTLARRERVFGPDNPDTLVSVHNLGVTLSESGRHEEAERLLRRALGVRERVLGPDHPSTLVSLMSLGSLYLQTEDLAAAERVYRESVARQERAQGRTHPDTLKAAHDLSVVLIAVDKLAEAEALLDWAVPGMTSLFGPGHALALTGLYTQGVVYLKQRRFDRAVEVSEAAARGFKTLPGGAFSASMARATIGLARLEAGRASDAEAPLLDGYNSLATRKTLPPRFRTRLRLIVQGLADVYGATDRPAKAAEWRAKAAALPPEVAPPPRPAK